MTRPPRLECGRTELKLQQIPEQKWRRLTEELAGYDSERYLIVEYIPSGGETQFSVRLMRSLDMAGWQMTDWMGSSDPTRWDCLTIKRSESSSGAEKLAGWMREQGLTVEETTVTQAAIVGIELWKG